MAIQLLRDIYQLVIGKQPIASERMLTLVFGTFGLAVSLAFIAVLSSHRPTPTSRPSAPTLPVTVELATLAPPSTEFPVPRPMHVVAPTVLSAAPADKTVEYHVKSGDTLIAILRSYCRDDYLVVARENAIDPNWIYAGKTVLKFKNGCLGNAPSVLVKQSVSPRELVSNGEASSGKHISSLAERDTEAQPLPPVAAPALIPSVSQPAQVATPDAAQDSQPLSGLRHREIYRIVALRNLGKERTKAQNAELTRLTVLIREEVLARYKLPNPDCLYTEASALGRNWEEQTLTRVRCIRENYGAVIDEVAAEHKLKATYIEALIMTESGGRPDAISPTGCTGLKQFTQRSAKLFGLTDRFDPFESIRAGGRHLEDNLRMWRGNVAQATAHWNIGSAKVGKTGFNAEKFPFTRSVLRIQQLIEKESTRLAKSAPRVVPVAYTSAR